MTRIAGICKLTQKCNFGESYSDKDIHETLSINNITKHVPYCFFLSISKVDKRVMCDLMGLRCVFVPGI